MSCPSFNEAQLKQFEKSIEKTGKIEVEVGFRIEKNGKLRVTDECVGTYCSVVLKPGKKQVGTWHSHPAKPSNILAPSPDDQYLAWVRGDSFHCVGGFGQYFEEKLDYPTTRCWVTKMSSKQMHEDKRVLDRVLFWSKHKERTDRAPRHLKALMLDQTEKQFEKLGDAIGRSIYAKRCEYVHEP